MVSVLVLFILLVGFGIAAVVFAYVATALLCRFFGDDADEDPRLARIIQYGTAYLLCYAGMWWVGLGLI